MTKNYLVSYGECLNADSPVEAAQKFLDSIKCQLAATGSITDIETVDDFEGQIMNVDLATGGTSEVFE